MNDYSSSSGYFYNPITSNSWATTTSLQFYYVPVEPIKRRNILNLYKVYIINAFTGSLLSEHTVIGKDQGEAALGVTLTEDEKALKAKDDLEMIWQRVGEFEKREVQRIRND